MGELTDKGEKTNDYEETEMSDGLSDADGMVIDYPVDTPPSYIHVRGANGDDFYLEMPKHVTWFQLQYPAVIGGNIRDHAMIRTFKQIPALKGHNKFKDTFFEVS